MTFFIDLDGTIIDSFERHYLLLQQLLKKYGIEKYINKEEYFKLKKNGINNYNYLINYLSIEKDLSLLIKNEWIENIENEEWLKYDKLFNDSLDFLDKNKDNKIVYLTARKNKKNTLTEIEKLGIKSYASDIYIVNSDKPIENKAEIIQRYKKKYYKEKIVIIGDTEVEYFAAKITNINYYILNRGFRSKEFLLKNNIKKTYCNFYEIIKEVQIVKCKKN